MNLETVAPSPVDLQSILNAIPGNHVILLPDAPTFTIVGATDSFLKTSYTTRDKIINRPLFEIFPEDKNDNRADGVFNLRASLEYVLDHKEIHLMADQRYDIINPQTGAFEFKVWAASNKPVMNAEGQIQCIIHTTEDITEKVRLQEEGSRREARLNESENRFRLMVEQAPVPILLSRGDDVVIETLNAPMLKAMNKESMEEVLGKKMLEVLPELKDQEVMQIVKTVQKTGVAFRGDEVPTDVLVDGRMERFYFNYSYTPIIEGNEITGVLHVALDITTQVEARKKIEESKVELKRFKFMADNAQDPFLLIREDGSFAYLNKKALELWGYTEEDVEHIRVSDIDPMYHEEKFREAFPQIVKQPVSQVEMQHRRRDGHIYPVEGSINGIVLDGKPHLFVVARDFTDRKKAEEALRRSENDLRNMILKAPIGIGIVAGNPVKMETVNDAFLELVGKSRHAFEQAPYWEVLSEAASKYEPILQEVFRTGETYRAEEHEIMLIRNNQEEIVYLTFVYEPLKQMDGKVNKVMILVLNVTEQTIARRTIEDTVKLRTSELASTNEALKQSNKELQRSNANLEEFAHAASHDLKEPVRKIHFYTNQLKHQLNKHLHEAQETVFTRIENATERMGNLIDDLLLYSHVSHRPPEMDSVDLNEKVKQVLEDLELHIEEKRAVVHAENLPTIKGYNRQIQQLFQNLISNALKYSKTDVHPRIDITANEVMENGLRYHQISVRDNGIGFDREYSDKIFQMFARLHGKGKYSGTGVGLSIVKKVVENHNGFIKVESVPGEGSTFKVYIPIDSNS